MGKKDHKKRRKKLEQQRLQLKKELAEESSVLEDNTEILEDNTIKEERYSAFPEVNKILDKLTYNYGVFPQQSIQTAIAKKDQIIPELLKILQQTPQEIDEQDSNYMAHIYAMYLLAQFREKQAYPLIIDFFSHSGDLVMNLTGDVVTEDLARILASVSCGDTKLIFALIENETVNGYVRGAALRSLLVLVAWGEKSRDEIVAYHQSLFRGKLKREHSQVWNALVARSTDLYPKEVYDDIKKAFEDDLVELFYIDLHCINDVLEKGQEKALEQLQGRYGVIF